MIQTKYKFINWLCMSALLFFACGLQTSFWHQLTSGIQAPQFWLLIILYLALYRSYYEAMVGAYFLALIIKSFSSVPLGHLWPILFLLITPTSYLKSKMFWPSTRYFVIAATGFALIYHIINFFLSRYLEINSAPLMPLTRLMEILLTTLWAAPFYWLMNIIDRLTLPEISESLSARE